MALDDTQEEVNHTDWVEFFVFVEVDEPKCADFGFACTYSLHFYLNIVDIFFHYKIINSLVCDFSLILLTEFFHETQHFVSASFDHVLVVYSRDSVGKVLHFLIM